jgi:transposase
LLVPDNPRTGVSRACRYNPDLNPTYQELALHYGVGVVPARPYRPRDKAKVEVGVQVTLSPPSPQDNGDELAPLRLRSTGYSRFCELYQRWRSKQDVVAPGVPSWGKVFHRLGGRDHSGARCSN